jgi:hypothetical protein
MNVEGRKFNGQPPLEAGGGWKEAVRRLEGSWREVGGCWMEAGGKLEGGWKETGGRVDITYLVEQNGRQDSLREGE